MIPEVVTKYFALPRFTSPGPGILREFIDSGTTTRDKTSLNISGLVKGSSVSGSMIPKTGIEVEEDCTISNYVTPIPHKGMKSKYITIVAGKGVKLELAFAIPGNIKG